jgi:hypothetical protein
LRRFGELLAQVADVVLDRGEIFVDEAAAETDFERVPGVQALAVCDGEAGRVGYAAVGFEGFALLGVDGGDDFDFFVEEVEVAQDAF